MTEISALAMYWSEGGRETILSNHIDQDLTEGTSTKLNNTVSTDPLGYGNTAMKSFWLGY